MTYAVESVRAAMDIRHGVGADAANISLDDPEDLFSHAGARLTVSFLDEIMTLAAGSIESAKPHVPHVMSELSGLMNIAQGGSPVPSTRRHSNTMMSLSAKAFPSSPIASERRLSVRNDAVTTDDSKASLGAVVVLNLASEEAFKHATSFPPPPGNLRYILQEHGGDIISSTATQERPGGGSATYRIVALFTSKNGESLVCSRDSPAPRAPQLLIEDATRCILSIADATSSLTSCGVSVGEVESFLAGPLWVHTGAPISLAQTAAISASQQSHAICFCPSTADLLASLPLLKFSEESKLCVPSFPSTSEISDFLTSTDSAFSQRLYIVLWRKRIAETKVMVQTLLSHLPILDNRHVTENETGFDEPMIFKTPTYSIIIQLTPLKNYNKVRRRANDVERDQEPGKSERSTGRESEAQEERVKHRRRSERSTGRASEAQEARAKHMNREHTAQEQLAQEELAHRPGRARPGRARTPPRNSSPKKSSHTAQEQLAQEMLAQAS
jgi:hypothetical protein